MLASLGLFQVLHIYQKPVASLIESPFPSIPIVCHRLSCSPCSVTLSLLLALEHQAPSNLSAFVHAVTSACDSFSVFFFLIISAFRACFAANFWRKPSLNSPGHNGFHDSSQNMHGISLEYCSQ